MTPLSLGSLEIENFRVFDRLKIDRLSRLNLIIGQNNIGKSTLLEALWLYANMGSPSVIGKMEFTRIVIKSRGSSVLAQSPNVARCPTRQRRRVLFFYRLEIHAQLRFIHRGLRRSTGFVPGSLIIDHVLRTAGFYETGLNKTMKKILDEIKAAQTSQKDKGTRFEQLILQFLKHDPAYSEPYKNVWLWQDFPGRDGKTDSGIDIVCELADGSGYAAVQCKFYDETSTLQKPDIDSFLAASSKKQFVRRIIVSTTAKKGSGQLSVASSPKPATGNWPLTTPPRFGCRDFSHTAKIQSRCRPVSRTCHAKSPRKRIRLHYFAGRH